MAYFTWSFRGIFLSTTAVLVYTVNNVTVNRPKSKRICGVWIIALIVSHKVMDFLAIAHYIHLL